MAETPKPRFKKRVVQLPDGRELVYYDQLPAQPDGRASDAASSSAPRKEA